MPTDELDDAMVRVWARMSSARVALLAAGLSYYLAVSIFPILVLGAGVLGLVSGRNDGFVADLIDWLGVRGDAATLVSESVTHAEQNQVTSSVVGVVGLAWAALAVAGALRRSVDAIWDVDDVGWTARLRSLPWAVVAGLLALTSIGLSGASALAHPGLAILAAICAIVFTALWSMWFLARLGQRRPTRRPLLLATAFLTIALELVKNSSVHIVPRLVSRESALYGAIGSALAVLVMFLVLSWVLLTGTAIAAELTDNTE